MLAAAAPSSVTLANASAAKACVHCGTTFEPAVQDEKYCCSGCAFVHDLIQQGGLDRFYDLKGTTMIQPVGTRAFRPETWDWLNRLATEAEASAQSDSARLTLKVQGLSCVGCVWLIKKVFEEKPGGIRVDIAPSRGTVEMRWQLGKFDVTGFAGELQRFGYALVENSRSTSSRSDSTEGRRLAVCGAFAANSMAFSLPRYLGMPDTFALAPTFELIGALSATLSFAVGGSYFIHRSWHSLRAGMLHVDTPIALGIITAYLGSLAGWMTGTAGLLYFDFVSVFIFLMLLGRRIQTSALEKNQRRLPTANIEESSIDWINGDADSVAVPSLKRGMAFRVKPGGTVPVSGRLLSADTSFGTESINGERDPRSLVTGTIVPSGAGLLGNAPAEIEAVEDWGESLLYRLVHATESANGERSPMEHVLRAYLAAVLLFGVGGFISYAIAGKVGMGLQVMISVFVVSCPCALGVALPLADDLAAARMSAIGVFVKRANLWQRLLKVRKIFVDKTGTLTPESVSLRDPSKLLHLSGRERSALQIMTASSLHPLSRTLYSALAIHAPGAKDKTVTGTCEEITGKGIQLTESDGTRWELIRDDTGQTSATQFRCDGAVVATFDFDDAPRAGAKEQIGKLQSKGIHFHILSGDAENKVSAMAAAVGIPLASAHGALEPADKATQIRKIGGSDALYLGDGANDSIALGEVLCSGALVADASLLQNKADFYVMGQSFRFLSPLIDTARQRCHAVRNAFAFAVLYNAACLTIALSGRMNPLLAAILMPLSSVATIAIVRYSSRKEASVALQSHRP
ncbi:MAG: heavy metal translocating P-type ATPase metal-binding domain-containing protein [Verrucomicrobiae bacterium]|nr:heavy metal translocating P-type ATPase metal-binding domain-containing protein [Verrucomicrobiae bacterium]